MHHVRKSQYQLCSSSNSGYNEWIEYGVHLLRPKDYEGKAATVLILFLLLLIVKPRSAHIKGCVNIAVKYAEVEVINGTRMEVARL